MASPWFRQLRSQKSPVALLDRVMSFSAFEGWRLPISCSHCTQLIHLNRYAHWENYGLSPPPRGIANPWYRVIYLDDHSHVWSALCDRCQALKDKWNDEGNRLATRDELRRLREEKEIRDAEQSLDRGQREDLQRKRKDHVFVQSELQRSCTSSIPQHKTVLPEAKPRDLEFRMKALEDRFAAPTPHPPRNPPPEPLPRPIGPEPRPVQVLAKAPAPRLQQPADPLALAVCQAAPQTSTQLAVDPVVWVDQARKAKSPPYQYWQSELRNRCSHRAFNVSVPGEETLEREFQMYYSYLF